LGIPRKSLVAACARGTLEARAYEIYLAAFFGAGGYHIARGKCIGAKGDYENKRDYD
jgi:hypothetical protein